MERTPDKRIKAQRWKKTPKMGEGPKNGGKEY